MDKVLVTGGAGYLGSILVPELLSIGYEVTVLDNFMYNQNSLAPVCAHPNFSVVKGDVCVESIIRPLAKKADIVIPLAGFVGAPLCSASPISAKSVNYDAVIMLLNLLSERQFVLMPTTNSAYGTSVAGNICTEESELRPISQYAREKVEIEKRLMDRTNSISFRLATVFGMSPRMRTDLLVNDFTYRAVKDRFIVLFESHFKRNYIHVRDVTRAFLHGLSERGNMAGEIFNVGLSDANVSKYELCQAIKKHVPEFEVMEAPVGSDPDQRNYVVSNAKLEGIGFLPEYSLDGGIQELIKGYQMITNSKYGNV